MEFDGWTLALQAINFLVLVWILQRFLYKPLLGLIDQRQRAQQDAFAQAAEREKAADASRAEYESRRQELDAERQGMLDEARAAIAKETEQGRAAARERANAELASSRSRIEKEREEAAASLTRDAVALAGELAQRLLAGVATADVAGSLLTSVLDRLDALTPERKQALHTDLEQGAKLVVASAPALGDDLRARCVERLRAALGPDTQVEFTTDEALLVGAELRFPNTTIGYCWRDTLAAALEELRKDG
ncbi:MAG: hypothetical protein KDB80_13385 [Planctomycetes bacterium]|nr:hypothetical protein [Planctomycetota bacterium]